MRCQQTLRGSEERSPPVGLYRPAFEHEVLMVLVVGVFKKAVERPELIGNHIIPSSLELLAPAIEAEVEPKVVLLLFLVVGRRFSFSGRSCRLSTLQYDRTEIARPGVVVRQFSHIHVRHLAEFVGHVRLEHREKHHLLMPGDGANHLGNGLAYFFEVGSPVGGFVRPRQQDKVLRFPFSG